MNQILHIRVCVCVCARVRVCVCVCASGGVLSSNRNSVLFARSYILPIIICFIDFFPKDHPFLTLTCGLCGQCVVVLKALYRVDFLASSSLPVF